MVTWTHMDSHSFDRPMVHVVQGQGKGLLSCSSTMCFLVVSTSLPLTH